MLPIATAIAPTLLLILTGFLLRRSGFFPEDVWPGLEKLTYFVLFPALLVRNLAVQDFAGVPWEAMLAVIAGTLAAAGAVLVAWHLVRRRVDGPTFTSIFQGGVRFNSYVALAVAQAFFGRAGLQYGAVAIGMLIVIINLACVTAFAVWGRHASGSLRLLARDIGTNPLILACVVGGVLGLTGIGLNGVVEESLDLVSRAALPVGLLAVGAVLQPRAIRGHLAATAQASAVQFVLKPAVAAWLVAATGLTGVAAGVLTIAFVTPAAPSAYILARQLGGNTELMASIITVQTVLAVLAMPAVIWLLS